MRSEVLINSVINFLIEVAIWNHSNGLFQVPRAKTYRVGADIQFYLIPESKILIALSSCLHLA